MKRESFIVYKSFFCLIKMLKPKERLKIFEAMFEYGFDSTIPEFDNETTQAVWEGIYPQLRANQRRYENGLKGKEFGVLGGRPNNNPNGDCEETPMGLILETPKITPNENVNENVNDNVNDNNLNNKKEKDITLPDSESNSIFHKALSSLEDKIAPIVYSTFFMGLENGGVEDNKLVIIAPSSICGRTITERHGDDIVSSVVDASGGKLKGVVVRSK